MPDIQPAITLTLHPHIAEIPAADWDACAGTLGGAGNPFVSHAFLSALEESGSANARTGWMPQHAALRDGDRLVAVAPMYAKSHSYGEYVFDHGWANAINRSGGDYYPKLQVAVPFSPVPGPRLLRRPGLAGEDLGATLGGAVVARELPDVPHRFFMSYGSRRGAMWASFRGHLRALDERGRGAHPLPVVALERAAGSVVGRLDVGLGQAERHRGLLHRVVKDIAQEEHGALLRRERLEREEERERGALEQIVAPLGAALARDVHPVPLVQRQDGAGGREQQDEAEQQAGNQKNGTDGEGHGSKRRR